MVGELITLPMRIGVRATRLWLRAAEGTLGVAMSVAGRVIGTTPESADEGYEPRPAPPERNGRGPATPAAGPPATGTIEEILARPPRPSQPPTPPAPEPSRPEPEPVHVSEEPSLVEEFAEPGAEDGAGAEIHIAPPWDGYEGMNVKQIVARLSSATPAELGAVQLYESSHRGRQTILNAVQRELRSPNGRSSGSQQRG